MKKQLVLLLITSMMCGLLAGCGNAEEEKESSTVVESSETQKTTETESAEEDELSNTFSVMLQATIEDASKMPINQVISEGTGIYPDYIEVSPAAAAEQYNLMWMTGEYEDVVLVGGLMDESSVYKYAEEGSIIDLAPYMTEENMPNFYKYVTEEMIKALKDSEGHIYFLPTFTNNRIGSHLAINQTWLDALELDMPETPEQLKEVWMAFKEKDPNGNGQADEIPFSSELIFSNALETLDPMFGMFGTCGGWQVDDAGKVFFGQATEDYKEGVKWFQECYKAGLIDAEIFTQDMTSYKAKSQSSTAILGSTLAFVYTAYTRSFTEDTVEQYVEMLPMKTEDGERLWTNPSENYFAITPNLVVTSACENPELVCKWADYMYDPNVGFQIDQIPFDYGLIEENGKWILDQEVYKEHEEFKDYESFADFRAAMHTNGYPRIITDDAAEKANLMQDIESNIIEVAHRAKDANYRENCRLTNFRSQDVPTAEETEIEATYLTEFTDYWRNTIARMIAGDVDVDAEWDAFLDGLDGMGLKELTEIYQARYDRYVSK